METNMYRSMLPLSICCLVLGFSTIRFKPTLANITVKAYCWLVTIFGFICWSASLIWNLLYNEKFNFIGIQYMIVDIFRITSVTYYRIMYMKNPNILDELLENMSYLDECLQSASIKVHHTMDVIFCALFIVVNLAIHIAFSYFVLLDINSKFNSVQNVIYVYSSVEKTLTYYSMLLLLMHFLYLVYVVKERLRLVHFAVEKYEETDGRRSAWTGVTTFSIAGGLRVLVIKRHEYLELLNILQNCMADVLFMMKNFYKYFFYTCVIFSVISTSFTIVHLATQIHTVYFFILFDHVLQCIVIPLYLCVSIANDFHKIHSVLYYLNITNDREALNAELIALHYTSMTLEKHIDFGYFKMEWALLYVIFNIVPLIVFSELPSPC